MTKPGPSRGTRRKPAAPATTAPVLPGLLVPEQVPSRDTTPKRSGDSAPSPGQHRLIRASAGTGKTYQLSGRFIARLRTAYPEDILATTFTRAAAGEILERVLLRLAEAATRADRLAELSAQVNLPAGEALTHADCLALLQGLTQQLHRVRVGTLDSFFIQLAQSFSLELGLPPGWRILDTIEEQQLQTQAIERLLHNHAPADVGPLLHLLSHTDGRRSVVRDLHTTIRQFYGVYLESSAEAWQCLPEPVPLTSGEFVEARDVFEHASEFLPRHKLWQKSHASAIQAVYDGNWLFLIKEGIGGKVASGEGKYCKVPIPPRIAGVYSTMIRHASAVLLRDLSSRNRVTWDLLHRLHAELQALKQEHQGLTFSDVTRALGAGWRQSALSRLDYRMDAAIEHLLLDEFQDTSIPQWQVLDPLVRHVTAHPHTSLFCVGDQKQAIYGWRGGVAELFDAVRERVPGLVDEPLSRSYRSSPAVIEAVNRVIPNLHHHPDLEDELPAILRWQERFETHETARQDLPGWVTLETSAEDDDASTFEHTARRVLEVYHQSPDITIGVLAKKNDSVATLARLIRSAGIEVSEEGRSKLDDNVGVKLVCSLLQLADHPGHTAARHHLLTSPLAGAALSDSPFPTTQQLAAWEHYATALRRDLLEQGYGRCLERWARAIAPHCDPRGVSRLRQLVDLAHGYEPHATQRPGDFLQFIDANPAVRPASARVRVMTIHHSKGLEFDVVFLTELNQSRLVQNPDYVTGHPSPVELPNAVIRYTREEVQRLLPDNLQAVFRENFERKVEEQLCVLYVALTRARHALHLVMRPADGPVKSSNMAGLLRAALTDGGALPPLTRLTISGDPDWIRQLPAPSGPAPSPAAETAPLRITLAPPRAGDLFAQQALRPSAHATGHLRLRQLLQPDNAGAMTRGTLIHAWCEKIDWLDETAPDLDRFRQIAARLEPQFEALEPTLAEFQRMLKRPNIAQLFSRAAYLAPRGLLSVPLRGRQSPPEFQVRTHAERRFVVQMDDQLVRGCIDRLVLIQQDQQVVAADIVDFKTDVLEDLARPVASQRLSDYREQLRLYVRAVSHLYDLPVEQIGARLVFLASGKIEVVSASSSRRSARTASDVPDDSNG